MSPVDRLEQTASQLAELAGALSGDAVRSDQATGRVQQDGRAGIGRQLAEPLRGPLGSERPGHRGQNSGVALSRISWLVTVAICVIAALLLLVNGYVGYSGVLLSVGVAAAVNLV